MVILGRSHHTWWAVLGVAINGAAMIYYLFRGVPVESKVRIANMLIVLFAGICVGALVFPLAGDDKIFALGCIRGNGAALIVNLAARIVLMRRSNKR